MRMRRFSLLLFIILPLLAVSSIVWFVYEYQLSSARHQALASAESIYTMTQAEISNQKAKLKRTTETTPEQKMTPNTKDESGVINEISSCAVQSGSHVQSLTFSGTKETAQNAAGQNKPTPNSVNLQVIATGTVDQLLNLVDHVQSNQRLVFIQNYEISVDQSLTQLTMELSFPYVKQG